MRKALQHLFHAVLRPASAGASDGQLLSSFIETRDEAAFATLVKHHGSMVLGVCRRILGNSHDAEDAFQATFLVLVRKAASIVPREMVGNWLYGVARQTAMKARAMTARRQACERPVAEMPEPPAAAPDLWSDLKPLLDRELCRLPEKYRVPIVLCDLEGKTQKETGEQLGWPPGTVSGRLARGRELLARRLARHGLAVPSGLLVLQNAASASLPAALAESTIKAAAAASIVSANVAALTQGVLKAMFLMQIKTVVGIVVLLAVGLGASVWFKQSKAGDQAAAPVAAEKQQVAEKPDDKKTDDKKADAKDTDAKKAAPDVADFEIVHLREVSASEMVQVLQQIIPASRASKMTIVAAQATNCVLIKGGKDEIASARAIIARLEDVAQAKRHQERIKEKDEAVKKEKEMEWLQRMLAGRDVEVFLDGDMQKPFLVGGRFAGVEELNGRKFFVFEIPKGVSQGVYKDKSMKRIIDSSRITVFSIISK